MEYKYNQYSRTLQEWYGNTILNETHIDIIRSRYFTGVRCCDWDVVKAMAKKNGQRKIEIRDFLPEKSVPFVSSILDVYTGVFDHSVNEMSKILEDKSIPFTNAWWKK